MTNTPLPPPPSMPQQHPDAPPGHPVGSGPGIGSGAGSGVGYEPQPRLAFSTIPTPRAAGLVARCFGKETASRGRLIAMGALALLMLVLAFLESRSPSASRYASDDVNAVRVFIQYGLRLAIPLFAVITATAGLGESHTNGTLVYLWLRPISRLSIALGNVVAAFLVALPFAVVTAIGMCLLVGGGGSTIAYALLATVLGTAAYVCLFGTMAIMFKHSIVWGLVFIVFWEGVMSAFGATVRRVTLINYTASIATHAVDESVPGLPRPTSVTVSVIVLAATCVVGIAFTTWRLSRTNIT